MGSSSSDNIEPSALVRQLLAFSPELQHLSLQLVDCLDDLLWAEIVNSNPLSHLVSLSLDQCHSLSGDSLQVSSKYRIFFGSPSPSVFY